MKKGYLLLILALFIFGVGAAELIIFDGSEYTASSASYQLVKTHTLSEYNSKVINFTDEIKPSSGGTPSRLYRNVSINYVDGTSVSQEDFNQLDEWLGKIFTNPNPEKQVATITVYLYTSDGSAGYTRNHTISGTRDYYLVNLTTPIENSLVLGASEIFNVSVTPQLNNLTNATIYVWNSTGEFNITTNPLTGQTLNSTSWDINFSESGVYLWNVWACGINSTATNCQWALNNRTLIYGITITAENYSALSYETQSEYFNINITLAEGVDLDDAVLWYRNTSYSAVIDSSGNDRTISRTLKIPTLNNSENVSFFWGLTISNETTTYFNTTANKQQVLNLEIDNCTVNSVGLINYTIYDEDDRTLLDPALNYNTSLNIYLKLTADLTGKVFVFYTNFTTSNPVRICISDNLISGVDYRLDSEVQYSSDDRVTEYHTIENVTVTNETIPLQYDLYDLLITSSQEFLLTARDSTYIPLSGAVIEITRQYLELASFLVVERVKTDNDGRTIGHFVLNDEVYTIKIYQEGSLIGVFSNVRAFCEDILTGDCRINLDIGASSLTPDDFINYKNISYFSEYDESNLTYSFIFSTIDGLSRVFEIEGIIADAYQNNTVCAQTLSASSGTLRCAFPSTYENSTGIINIYVDGSLFSHSVFPITPSRTYPDKILGYLIAFFLILTLPLLVISSPTMVLVLFLLGVITSGSLFFIGLGGFVGALSAFLWLVIATVILLIRIKKGDEGG